MNYLCVFKENLYWKAFPLFPILCRLIVRSDFWWNMVKVIGKGLFIPPHFRTQTSIEKSDLKRQNSLEATISKELCEECMFCLLLLCVKQKFCFLNYWISVELIHSQSETIHSAVTVQYNRFTTFRGDDKNIFFFRELGGRWVSFDMF